MRRAIMMTRRSIALYLCLMAGYLYGCAHNLPPGAGLKGEASRTCSRTGKVQTRVGVYIGNDLQDYAYRVRHMGITLLMNVGGSLSAVLPQMMSAMMLNDFVVVKSPPPYDGDYRPDVDVVIEPDILYAYGNAAGSVGGRIDSKIILRLTIYDMDGRILWQDEATGASLSEDLNLLANYPEILEEADKTAYEAIFSAAAGIADDFNSGPPEIFSVPEGVQISVPDVYKGNLSDMELFRQYLRAGQFYYKEKRFYQALHSFEKAACLNPGDLSTLFYLAACYTYTGEKDEALQAFRRFSLLTESKQELSDSDRWINLLEEPLKIGVVLVQGEGGGKQDNAPIEAALIGSRMYDVVKLKDSGVLRETGEEFERFLEECLKKGIRVLVYDEVDYSVRNAVAGGQNKEGGDTATEYTVGITARVYSTKKKDLTAEIRIEKGETVIGKKNEEKELAIRDRLLKKGARELVLRLLESEIF